jgi:hypothetical protein
MTTDGSLTMPMNRGEGLPNSVTAATWFATAGGIGPVTPESAAPAGTVSEVTKPATAAPWE